MGKRGFLIRHWKLLSILIVLSVMIAYHFIKLEMVNTKHKNEVTKIKEDYELLLESSKTAYFSSLIEVLSWAIKSEMVRNNNENAFIYLQNVVKLKFLVLQADLIDPENGNVNFSTNPTTINSTIELVDYDKVRKMDDDFYYIPVMGDSEVISILRVKFE